MLRLYDAPRCPYCARVRIVLAEKAISYETVLVDLDERPGWIYDLNPSGRVPVLEDDGFVLAESRVLMEYLEERFPEPSLLPADADRRALVRLRLERFEQELASPYYELRRERSTRSRISSRNSRMSPAPNTGSLTAATCHGSSGPRLPSASTLEGDRPSRRGSTD
jgi:glutathione S-transferase